MGTKDKKIETQREAPCDTAHALAALDGKIDDPCKCLAQYGSPDVGPSPFAKEYYTGIAQRIPKTIEQMQQQTKGGSSGFYERLSICNFPPNDEKRIRTIIETLTQDGPEYSEKDGQTTIKRNPKAKYLIQIHLKPGLIAPEHPVVTVNARKIREDQEYLRGLLKIYRHDPARSFLCHLIAQLEAYGNIDSNQMRIADTKRNRPVNEAFKKMGRATLFIVFAAGTLLSGILSIIGKQSPTAAAIYGALAFFVANPEILGPTEQRDVNRALQAIGAAGLKGRQPKTHAALVERLFTDKAVQKKVQNYLSSGNRTEQYRSTLRKELFDTLKTDAESERILKDLLADDKAFNNLVRGLRNANTKGAREHVLNYLDPTRMRGKDGLYALAR